MIKGEIEIIYEKLRNDGMLLSEFRQEVFKLVSSVEDKEKKYRKEDLKNAIDFAIGLGKPVDEVDFEQRDEAIETYLNNC